MDTSSTPRSLHFSYNSRPGSTPCAYPASFGSPRSAAQRRLPSGIKPTWRGTLDLAMIIAGETARRGRDAFKPGAADLAATAGAGAITAVADALERTVDFAQAAGTRVAGRRDFVAKPGEH